ncbi:MULTISPECIES: D-ribose ABC transporter substrate-binding protein [unclassified Enterococcus]|uniref:D-ribose ABC transporter substrate-binding protein n=1 Tax=unclassified Enterococcus TaxID=2608891 RepID=UPI001CE16AFB|nr:MULTISPECIES: D-ribose ABC transporter substrate-binding protein [unclassified Enterococcus]MCA5013748.1 D-ribose ABC transporter substrate-binding protein [Enterococcus sp. S23]MCA5016998.1 D-ribose ABC transporter substrate-binding protein [Enterococcus sp. S22(2020)]
MKKLFISMMAAVLLLSGCGAATLGDNESKGDTKTEEKKAADLKVGVSISTLNNPFFVSVKDGITTLADENKTKTIISDAQNDASKQSNDIDDLIQQKVDVILVNPVDSSAIQPAVEAANEANIPVIALDRSSDGGEILTLVASDNVKGGEMAADFIIEKVGKGAKVVQLEGTPGASATRERGKGFENIAKNDLDVVQSQSADFDRAKGLSVMENILQSNSDIKAVFAQNDEMALGAVEALKAAGKKDVLVVGFDGNEDGIKAVEAGTMGATVAQQPVEMGKLALQAAYDHFEGKEVESKIDSPLELMKAK